MKYLCIEASLRHPRDLELIAEKAAVPPC
jgi:hypothetical protein